MAVLDKLQKLKLFLQNQLKLVLTNLIKYSKMHLPELETFPLMDRPL